MSLLRNCIRFSWDVVKEPNHSWGGTNDKSVESLVRQKVMMLSDHYKEHVEDKSPAFYQVSLPMLLMLRNSKHSIVEERNFWWDATAYKLQYGPKDWGKYLNTKDRDMVQARYGIRPEHRFVLYLSEDHLQEAEFISRLVMTCAFTTYVLPSVLSLNDLVSMYADNSYGQNESVLDVIEKAPLLILTDVFGECDRIKFASGALTTMLKERMYRGRTTVFCDAGKVKYPIDGSTPPSSYVNSSGMSKSKLADFIRLGGRDISINNTQLHSFFFGGMTYVMDVKSFAAGFHTSIE